MEEGRGDQPGLEFVQELDQAISCLGGQGGDEPGGDRTPEQGDHRLCGAFDGKVLAHEEIEDSGTHIRSVRSDSSRFGWEGSFRPRSTDAPLRDRTMLGAAGKYGRWGVEHLTALHPLDRCIGEVVSTRAAVGRWVVDDLVRVGPH